LAKAREALLPSLGSSLLARADEESVIGRYFREIKSVHNKTTHSEIVERDRCRPGQAGQEQERAGERSVGWSRGVGNHLDDDGDLLDDEDLVEEDGTSVAGPDVEDAVRLRALKICDDLVAAEPTG
jgi:hypothetical protein